jgi:hypothetical protein
MEESKILKVLLRKKHWGMDRESSGADGIT